MTSYKNYNVTDFIFDKDFRNWVLLNSNDSPIFWHDQLEHNSNKEETIELSRKTVLAFHHAQNEISDFELTEAIANIVQVASQSNIRKVNFWRTIRKTNTAAAVLLVPLLGWFTYHTYSEYEAHEHIGDDIATIIAQNTTLIEKENHSNSPELILLSDGSSIILEPNSKLSYPKTFKVNKREVVLSGNAFFEISKNLKKPFLVYANEIVAKVVGTSFTIKASSSSKKIEILVKTGRVGVATFRKKDVGFDNYQTHNAKIPVIVNPHQRATFTRNNSLFVKSELSQNLSEDLTEVHKQVFVFNNTSVVDIFVLLEKYYGIAIIYDKNTIKLCTLTAELTDEPFIEKIDIICKAIDARYEYTNGAIIVTAKGCN